MSTRESRVGPLPVAILSLRHSKVASLRLECISAKVYRNLVSTLLRFLEGTVLHFLPSESVVGRLRLVVQSDWVRVMA